MILGTWFIMRYPHGVFEASRGTPEDDTLLRVLRSTTS
jgi:hypothetical protein